MTADEMWQAFRQANPHVTDKMQSWQFGEKADLLADLVLRDEKTATSSAHALYAAEGEPLPQAGSFHVIEDSGGRAVCIVEITRVRVEAFCRVPAEHAAREGEGDKSLEYWRRVHRAAFTQWLAEAGLAFAENSPIVLEEFRRVWPLAQAV